MSGLPSFLPGVDVASGLARVAGNAKLYIKLLHKVAEEAPTIKQSLSAAIVDGDAVKVREVAHSLKGAAGNLSITKVAEAAQQVEQAAKAEDFAMLFVHLDSLDEAFEQFVSVVNGLDIG